MDKYETTTEHVTDVHKTHDYLSNNTTASIVNPLQSLTRQQLLDHAETFAQKHNLTDVVDELKKGALVAQTPDDFESISLLTEADKEALRKEQTSRWSHPLSLYLTIILCSVGACTQGWDQTGSNGANLSFPDEFGIGLEATLANGAVNPDYDRNNWLVGLVNSAPYLSAAFITSWLSDPVNNLLGRRGTIFLAGVFCLLAPIGSATTQTWPQLFVCRLLLGLGVGFKEVTAPVFAAENSPAQIRGALVMSWQLWTAFGIFLGFCANLVFFKVGTIAWRLQVGSACVPAIPLLVLVLFCPESPRWYMKKNRYRKAWNSLVRLRHTPVQAARDLYYIAALLEEEKEIVGKSNFLTRYIELFTVPRIRRATLASWVVMIAQQMCGINIISFFSSSIFAQATTDPKSRQPLWASFGFGLINFVFAWPAVFTIDLWGRRNLLLFTFPNMAWTLLVAGFCFFIPPGGKARLAAVATFVYLFTAFYSPGEGPVPFTYSAEVFPLSHREVGMAWAVATNNFYGAILSISYFRIQSAFTIVGAFGFYAGLNVLAFVMIFLWMPETKERTLEELDYVFGVPTKIHMHYQITQALPYFVRRHVLMNKSATLQPLYHMDRLVHDV